MELVFWIMIFFAGLFLIMKSAGYAVTAVIQYAEKTGMSKYFVGLLVVSIGTSLPELFTGIISSLQGAPALIAGDAIGATIVDVTLVLGFVAVLAKKLKINGKIVHISIPKVLLIVILPLILGFDGMLSRADGILLLTAFLIYYLSEIISEARQQKLKPVKLKHIWKEIIIFGFNIGLLLFGAQLLVTSSIQIATHFNIPMYLFGAIFLAVCTTSPEFIVELKAIKQKAAPVAFGDIFGSVVTNTSLVIGLAAIINPFVIDRASYAFVNGFMVVAVGLGLSFIKKGELTRNEGWVLGSMFFLFVLVNLLLL